MPEIMSAEEVAIVFHKTYPDRVLELAMMDDCPMGDEYLADVSKPIAEMLRSRDSAIIEKCKETLIGCLSGTGNLGVCQMALDSVLSDINGGK